MSQRTSAGPSTSSRRVSRVVGDSDDDSEQPRTAQAGSSKRRLVKGEQNTNVDEDGDEDDVFGQLAQPLEMPQIDDEFRNVALKRDDAGLKLNNLLKEWKDVERKVQGHMELLGASAGELQESLIDIEDDNEEAEEELVLADRDFRKLLDKMYEIRVRKESLERLRALLGDGRPHPDALEEMEGTIIQELVRYNSQTSREKYLDSEPYNNFRTMLWESKGTSQGIPNIKTFIAREDGDPESEDEDIEVQAVAQNYKDPITFTWLEKPVKSNACKHVYSRASIEAHIRQSPNRTSGPCPVAGCNKIVILTELQDDHQLERRVQQQKRREAEQQDRAGEGYQAIDDDEDSDEDDLNVRRVKKREG